MVLIRGTSWFFFCFCCNAKFQYFQVDRCLICIVGYLGYVTSLCLGSGLVGVGCDIVEASRTAGGRAGWWWIVEAAIGSARGGHGLRWVVCVVVEWRQQPEVLEAVTDGGLWRRQP